MAKRIVWYVEYSKQLDEWVIKQGKNMVDGFPTKAEAIDAAARRLDSDYKTQGILSQLRIRNKDGRIASERTYGNDPKRYPS